MLIQMCGGFLWYCRLQLQPPCNLSDYTYLEFEGGLGCGEPIRSNGKTFMCYIWLICNLFNSSTKFSSIHSLCCQLRKAPHRSITYIYICLFICVRFSEITSHWRFPITRAAVMSFMWGCENEITNHVILLILAFYASVWVGTWMYR